DRGRPLNEAERTLLRSLIAVCGDQEDASPERLNARAPERLSAHRRQIVMEELARKDPALSVLVARHFLACDLVAMYGGAAATPLLHAWSLGERVATIAHTAWDAPGAGSGGDGGANRSVS